MMWFEDLIQYMSRRPDVWFATHREIAERFVSDEQSEAGHRISGVGGAGTTTSSS